MTPALNIPEDHQLLVACLRRAVQRRPADHAHAPADWAPLFRQARQHGVDAFLYPWLAHERPDLFSSRATASPTSAPAAWRAHFLASLRNALLRERQLAAILRALAEADIEVIPLKGAWLCEQLYDDPALRSMSDLDLLIRESDRDACHAAMTGLGYTTRKNVLHSEYACDQSYYSDGPVRLVEIHWQFACKMADLLPAPDISALWSRAEPASCCGLPVRQFAPEDLLTHLVQHGLHHLLALPLRAWLDIALFVRRFGDALTPDRLGAAAGRWHTGQAAPFFLRFACALFELPLPAALDRALAPLDQSMASQACSAFSRLPPATERHGELNLLRFKQASWTGRLRLAGSRVFMPRAFLALQYPCARTAWGLPAAWLLRARDLWLHKRGRLRSILTPGTPEAASIEAATNREALVRRLLQGTKKPG